MKLFYPDTVSFDSLVGSKTVFLLANKYWIMGSSISRLCVAMDETGDSPSMDQLKGLCARLSLLIKEKSANQGLKWSFLSFPHSLSEAVLMVGPIPSYDLDLQTPLRVLVVL